MAARSSTKNFLVQLVLVQALAVLHAMKLCRKMGFIDTILERDVLQIVNAVKTTCNNWSNFRHIVD